MHFDLVEFIKTVGYAGIFSFVFAESGLFFGFFLPGDSLLLTAGLLASRGVLDIVVLIVGVFICAVLGDNVGYWFGAKVGPPIFNRPNSRFFKRKNLLKAKEFYDKYGAITITAARFMPFIRTFAPIVAGAVAMNYRTFIVFNLLGGVLWGIGMTTLGYALGVWFGTVEGIDTYFSLLVLAFFIIPGLPTAWHLWQENKNTILAYAKAIINRQPLPRIVDEEDERSVASGQ
ncbi:MAG: DedA family protein [Chloroflexi bacterium]|nr:DedA family protein [Chloroflexota bacterium]